MAKFARILTEAEIEAGSSAKGGFTRARLAEWGVPWPPPKGWRDCLMAGKPVSANTETNCVSFQLTPERAGKLRTLAEATAIDWNHYALLMLSRAIDRGDWLVPEDWWEGRPEDLAAFKREFGPPNPMGETT